MCPYRDEYLWYVIVDPAFWGSRFGWVGLRVCMATGIDGKAKEVKIVCCFRTPVHGQAPLNSKIFN